MTGSFLFKENKEGLAEIILTKDGEKKALRFKIDEMEIKKPPKWDGEWRIVILTFQKGSKSKGRR